MRKIILLIITFLILVCIITIGILYFIEHGNNQIIETEYVSSVDDIIKNADEKEEEIKVSENIVDEESIKDKTTETSKEEQGVIEIKQIATQNTQAYSQSNNSSSNQETKETVVQVNASPKISAQTTPSPISQSVNNQSSKTEETKKEEIKTESKVEKCTNNNNHSLSVGNSGKWFNSKNEAIAYYNEKIKYWGEQWENNKIDNNTYYKNCPSGYEVWDCIYCGKWTINFYYR